MKNHKYSYIHILLPISLWADWTHHIQKKKIFFLLYSSKLTYKVKNISTAKNKFKRKKFKGNNKLFITWEYLQ